MYIHGVWRRSVGGKTFVPTVVHPGSSPATASAVPFVAAPAAAVAPDSIRRVLPLFTFGTKLFRLLSYSSCRNLLKGPRNYLRSDASKAVCSIVRRRGGRMKRKVERVVPLFTTLVGVCLLLLGQPGGDAVLEAANANSIRIFAFCPAPPFTGDHTASQCEGRPTRAPPLRPPHTRSGLSPRLRLPLPCVGHAKERCHALAAARSDASNSSAPYPRAQGARKGRAAGKRKVTEGDRGNLTVSASDAKKKTGGDRANKDGNRRTNRRKASTSSMRKTGAVSDTNSSTHGNRTITANSGTGNIPDSTRLSTSVPIRR